MATVSSCLQRLFSSHEAGSATPKVVLVSATSSIVVFKLLASSIPWRSSWDHMSPKIPEKASASALICLA